MIDKEMFPDEYEAIERLKANSRMIERIREKKKQEKLKRIEECRRMLDEKHTS